MANKDQDHRTELYARGFIFHTSAAPLKVPEHWEERQFCHYRVVHDPRFVAHRAEAQSCEMLALGVLFDVRSPGESTLQVVQRLTALLAESEDAFFEEIDFLGGRHVIAYRRGDGRAFLLTDAVGVKSTFHRLGRDRIIASSPRLLLDNAADAELRPDLPLKWGYPGRCSPVRDAFLLTPNTRLDLDDFTIHRFWPRGPLPTHSLEEATDLVEGYLKGAAEFLGTNFDPLLSLTGGLDSRVTLSLLRHHPRLRCFNYFRRESDGNTDELDRKFATEMNARFDVPVDFLNLADYPPQSKTLYGIQDRNSYYPHNRRIASIYFRKYAHVKNLIHVRSSVSEVGREFYSKSVKYPVRNARDLAKVYLGNRQLPTRQVFDIIEMFEDFAATTHFFEQVDTIDPLVLFYWEFRLAAWQSQVEVESEIAFDSVSIFNCRRTLQALLSVTPKERELSLIAKKVIERNWPELTEYPVNGRDFWSNGLIPGTGKAGKRNRNKVVLNKAAQSDRKAAQSGRTTAQGDRKATQSAQVGKDDSRSTGLERMKREVLLKGTKRAEVVLSRAATLARKAHERLAR